MNQFDSRRENLIVTLLAAINFTHILDFVVMMPLGPTLMRVLEISASEFAMLVSAYTWSASLMGLAGSLFIDRFDRKLAMIIAFVGFAVGTLACAMAPNFAWLFAARVTAGAFGGLVGTLVFSVLGDVIPYQRRGLAMGRISSAFSLASIFGVPAGLWLSQYWSWHAPFLAIGFLALILVLGVALTFPKLTGHLANAESKPRTIQTLKNTVNLIRQPSVTLALGFASVLTLSGFLVIPMLSPSLVHNVGLKEADLPLTYLVGGFFTFFSAQWIGRLSDRFGKHTTFRWIAWLSAPALMAVTILPPLPLSWALVATTTFMVFVSGRFVPAMAMVTEVPPASQRGAFMSVYSSAHNAAGGFAAWAAGTIVAQDVSGTGPIHNYPTAGAFAVAATIVSIVFSYRLVVRGTKV